MHNLYTLLNNDELSQFFKDVHIFNAHAWNNRFLWAIEALVEYAEPSSEEVFLKGDVTSEDSIWERENDSEFERDYRDIKKQRVVVNDTICDFDMHKGQSKMMIGDTGRFCLLCDYMSGDIKLPGYSI